MYFIHEMGLGACLVIPRAFPAAASAATATAAAAAAATAAATFYVARAQAFPELPTSGIAQAVSRETPPARHGESPGKWTDTRDAPFEGEQTMVIVNHP